MTIEKKDGRKVQNLPTTTVQHPLRDAIGVLLGSEYFQGLNPLSQDGYQTDLSQMQRYFEGLNIADGTPLTADQLRTYADSLTGYRASTYRRKRSVINLFLQMDPTISFKLPNSKDMGIKSKPSVVRSPLTEAEQAQLLEVASASGKGGLRDTALFSVLLNVPCHPLDIIRLKVDQIVKDTADGAVELDFNGKYDPITLTGSPAEYLCRLRDSLQVDQGPLFLSHPDYKQPLQRPLTRQGFYLILSRYGQKIERPDLDTSVITKTAKQNLT